MRASLSLVLFVLVASLVLAEAARKGKGKGKKKPSPYEKYTKSSDCACWWDLGAKKECGCCQNGGVQCGWPKDAFCGEKSNKGCTGIVMPTKDPNQLTLSRKGFPCYWDHSDLSCAWCKLGSYQCAKGKEFVCASEKYGTNKKKCDGVKADCNHFGKDICDINAECLEGKGWNKGLFACRCKEGWTGNGLQCVDEKGEFGENPNKIVDLEMTLTTDFLISNSEEGVYPYGPSQDNLFSLMSGMFEGSPACNGCNATMINLSAPGDHDQDQQTCNGCDR